MKKMRVCTLTHHTVPNYGAILQAYALQKKLDELDVSNEILNYISSRVERNYYKDFKLCNTWKMKILYLINYNSRKRNLKFERFIKENLRVSHKYEREELYKSNNIYDLFITGSDQVWNLNIHQGDTTYMLDFVEDSRKKGSYAASFGYSEIPEKYREISYEYLKKLNCFLIRENRGKKILSELGIKIEEQHVVLDPTLLLDEKYYHKFVSKKSLSDYVLVYDLINSKELRKFALNLASKKKLSVKSINTGSRIVSGMKNIRDAGPEEFLDLIANAKYIVTSSYHGIIFSLIFEKNFFYALNKNKKNNNSRIMDLATLLGLEDREIGCCEAPKEIDYNKVNKRLKSLRENSILNILEMINKTKGLLDL